ncbi:MAG: hypothetical protein KAR16_01220 [Bacteroidales bacterium]|nr:hypothetical protein [Bacteroidales bacterium]
MLKRRIPYVFLFTALLAIPFYYLRDEMDTEEIKKHRHWIAKTRNSDTFRIVFGGDSRVFRGISPEHFSAEFDGIESFNYAYWANGYGKDYLEGIEKKMDSGSDFRMIVLGVSPHSLTKKTARSKHYQWEQSRSKEHVLQTLYFSKIQEIFTPYDAIELAEKLTGKSKPNNYRITYHPNGWVESYWIVSDTTHAARSYKNLFKDDPVSDEVIQGLLEFVERWTNMGIVVVGFRPPASYTIRGYERDRGGFSEVGFVERFTNAGGIWIPVSPDAYQTFDGSHLEHKSAMRLSGDLARQIRQEIKTESR